MTDTWVNVDEALADWLLDPDDALDAALAASAAAGLPAINVSPLQGKFLYLFAVSMRATNILEIGTLGGYSTIWLARALAADGHLTTLEREQTHADVARANIARAGLGDRVSVVVGPAAETLPTLDSESYDLTFIDADKAGTPHYFDWAVAHTRAGGVVIVDNVVRRGAVLDEGSTDENVEGMRRFLAAAGRDPRVSVTAVQTVGVKGHDGFALAVVR